MPDEIFEAIRNVHDRQVFAVHQLDTILTQCGLTQAEITAAIRSAIERGKMARLSFRKVRRRPPKNSYLAIL